MKTKQTTPATILTVILMLLGVVYIAEMTHISTQGYEIQELQKEVKNARQHYTDVNLVIAQSGSISSLRETELVQESMVAANYQFLTVDSSLVQK
jgi:hypothetical protein